MFSHPDSSDKWDFTSAGSQMGSLNHRQLDANEDPLIWFGSYCFLVFCFLFFFVKLFFNVRNTQRVFQYICVFLKNSYQLPSVAFFMYSQYWGATRSKARRDQGRSQSEEDKTTQEVTDSVSTEPSACNCLCPDSWLGDA